ncbi:MAG TPA: bifunctional shikimate kinase/3-dehydroquinate synthase [Gaiellaceae bacterium]|nr:bifunctional shikimate kinase/3-dehydroquinate synthase [Gaiellaceae bacterium]
MVSRVGALDRHLALVGFMGAGKTTVGREVAAATHRPFVDTDGEIERRHGPIPRIFEERGEEEFRLLEERVVAEVLCTAEPAVIALGGGAVLSERTRALAAARAFPVWLTVEPDDAWRRSSGGDRPLARDEAGFRRLYEERLPLYEEVAGGAASDGEGVLLAALSISVGRGASRDAQGEAIVADQLVLAIHCDRIRGEAHVVPSGEDAKTLAVVERLWRELTVGRDGTIVAFGGGSTTDVVGFVAATYLRGVRWIAVPTTLTGQVDAAIGGKTGINTPDGKNLAGAFHFPERVLVDPDLLATLPEAERRAGMAEVVKTGLLAGRPVWELPAEEMIRACAAYKAGVVLSDPYETDGRRARLNLGHTFAHALEAGSGYRVSHGDAVALGLLAALRLSGLPTDAVEEILRPEPVEADLDVAWAALRRDKKGEGVFVLLEAPARPVVTTVPEAEARAALAALVRQ